MEETRKVGIQPSRERKKKKTKGEEKRREENEPTVRPKRLVVLRSNVPSFEFAVVSTCQEQKIVDFSIRVLVFLTIWKKMK